MISFRTRPKGKYIQQASWQDLYILTEKWEHAIEFQVQEIEFLERLIEAYFIKLLLQENLDDLIMLQRDLATAHVQAKRLLERTQIHMTHIIDLLDSSLALDAEAFRTQHAVLEDHTSDFVDVVKQLRFSVFKLTKSVLDQDKPKYLWKYN
ncbi:MAG: hypothetical protein ABJQ39_10375 [Winogradskyella arenosi]